MENLIASGAQVSLISDLFRAISLFLDSIVYGIIPLVFDLIYQLYELPSTIGSVAILKRMATSAYSLLAIFMFFRVAFSLLGMLVEPSMIEDKQKGMGKLVSNIAICLVLIVMIPTIFEYASMAQSKIMEDNLIESAIYGSDFGNEEKDTLGRRLSTSTWGLFVYPTTESGKAVEAYNEIFDTTDGEFVGLSNLWGNLNKTTSSDDVWSGLDKIFVTTNKVAQAFGEGSRYQLAYLILISTAVGGWLLWSIIKLCIDIAYRSIKMFALQLLAPIAIVSYIDPKSGKDGVFSKWLAESVKTYISLFIRIFVFAFASVLLHEINLADYDSLGLVPRIFFILALVSFFKNAPKFIDGILGTELEKGSEAKFGSEMLRAATGAAVTGGASLIGTAVAGRKAGLTPGQNLKKSLSSALSSGKKGFSAGKKGFGGWGAGEAFGAARKDLGIPSRAEEKRTAKSEELYEKYYDKANKKFNYSAFMPKTAASLATELDDRKKTRKNLDINRRKSQNSMQNIQQQIKRKDSLVANRTQRVNEIAANEATMNGLRQSIDQNVKSQLQAKSAAGIALNAREIADWNNIVATETQITKLSGDNVNIKNEMSQSGGLNDQIAALETKNLEDALEIATNEYQNFDKDYAQIEKDVSDAKDALDVELKKAGTEVAETYRGVRAVKDREDILNP